MATEKQTQTTTSKRIFAGLDSTSVDTQYKKPNFSRLDFEDTKVDVQKHYETDIQKVSIENPKSMDMLTIDEQIGQKPETPVKVRLNARGKIIVSVIAICICALMAFMIGNIVTINSLSQTVSQKTQLVNTQQQTVNTLQQQYDYTVSQTQDVAGEYGYIASEQTPVYIEEIADISRDSAVVESNWFDDLCNFLANLFN